MRVRLAPFTVNAAPRKLIIIIIYMFEVSQTPSLHIVVGLGLF